MYNTLLKKIDYIPIDLPILQVEYVNITYPYKYNWWQFQKLIKSEKKYDIGDWINCKTLVETQIKDFICKYIPIDHFVNVKINQQLFVVDEHIDFVNPELNKQLYKYSKETEPCGYRILLHGNRYALTVNKKQAILPSTTNVYCIRQTETLHSVKQDNNRISIFIQGWVNKEKHYSLLEKSYNKYKEYIIWKN